MIRRPPRSTQGVSSAASDVYKRQGGSGLPVPQTIELDYDELEAVAKDRDVDVDFLWMAAQAMCFSPAEMASMDAATAEKVDNLRERPEFERYLHAALDVPAVRRRFEEVQWARASSEQASHKAASEPVDDPRARRIEVAAAVCEAATRAVPPDEEIAENPRWVRSCLLYTSPSPRDRTRSRMPSSA